MSDDQVMAIMVCLFRVAERIDRTPEPRPLAQHIDDARMLLYHVRKSSGTVT